MKDNSQALCGLFITGTDTDVGKTLVMELLLGELQSRGVRVGAYKPVCTGSESTDESPPRWRDIDRLCSAQGGDVPADRVCPQRFLAPLAPPVAASLEGLSVQERLIEEGIQWWRDRVDLLLVEGVGGLLCPLTHRWTVASFAARLSFPLIIVAAQKLGTINHTLLTVEVARKRKLPIAGIIMNETTPIAEESCRWNIEQISSHCDVPILARVTHGEDARLHPLPEAERIDWTGLALMGSGHAPDDNHTPS